MKQTSINVQPIKGGSEVHNLRQKDFDYVRKELTERNESFVLKSVSEVFEDIKNRYQATTGQKMQKKATPIREGVVVIDEGTTMEQLKNLGEALQNRFGIKCFQIHIHRDEGHHKAKEWKPNLHAHMVFDWTQDNGKSIRLNRQQMSEMQTIVANVLGMERGKKSDKKHLTAIQYKNQQEERKLKLLEQYIDSAEKRNEILENEINDLKAQMNELRGNGGKINLNDLKVKKKGFLGLMTEDKVATNKKIEQILNALQGLKNEEIRKKERELQKERETASQNERYLNEINGKYNYLLKAQNSIEKRHSEEISQLKKEIEMHKENYLELLRNHDRYLSEMKRYQEFMAMKEEEERTNRMKY